MKSMFRSPFSVTGSLNTMLRAMKLLLAVRTKHFFYKQPVYKQPVLDS